MKNEIRGRFSNSFIEMMKADGTVTSSEQITKDSINWPRVIFVGVLVVGAIVGCVLAF